MSELTRKVQDKQLTSQLSQGLSGLGSRIDPDLKAKVAGTATGLWQSASAGATST